jgi:AAA+ ATPase superfamily predicted ATPase
VLVTGARQVGKTTLLRHAYPGLKHLVFSTHSRISTGQRPIRTCCWTTSRAR